MTSEEMTAVTEPVSARLRSATRGLHATAERHPLQRAMAKGALNKELYTAFLGQMLIVHAALEDALRAAGEQCDPIRRLALERCYQAPRIRADLRFFGTDPDALNPTPATAVFRKRLDDVLIERPVTLLGYLYVLEGSNNGAKFIAVAARRAYELTGDQGVSFLDPYGDRQPEFWAEFKETIDAQDFDAADVEAIIESAREMYRAISAIGDDLIGEHPIDAATNGQSDS